MGVELNVNHIRAVREGYVTATGTPLHLGRTTAVWDMRVHDDDGRLVAVSRLTVAIRDATRE
jgi:1,4-dihydroxy-2-naphthoyl-CoA hydrolase